MSGVDRPSLPPPSSTRCPIAPSFDRVSWKFPGETSGLPSSVRCPQEVRSPLFPGFATAVYGDGRTPYPVHLPFWSRLVSILSLFSFTRFIRGSHVVLHTLIPSSLPRDARRIEIPSRVSLIRAPLSPGSRPRIAGLYGASQAREPLTAQRVRSQCSTAQLTTSCHSAPNQVLRGRPSHKQPSSRHH